MSWGRGGRRWTIDELNIHIGSKELAKLSKVEKKISPEQSKIDADERRKFRDHIPTGKHKFCESFLN